jgi:hypothetical protein
MQAIDVLKLENQGERLFSPSIDHGVQAKHSL